MTWSRRNLLKLMPGMALWPALATKARGMVKSADPAVVLPGAAPGPVPAGSNQRTGQTYSKLGYKVYILDFQFSDLDPDTLKNADANTYADAMVEMGVETLLVYANNVYGINFFKSQ